MPYKRKLTSSNAINRTYLSSDCSLTIALETLGGRWTTQVLYLISFGENRFSMLKKRLPGISDQILGLRLNHLIENKLMQKTETNGEKIYVLTEKAQKLIAILDQLVDWQTNKRS